jgi:hypothetical protein
VGRRVEFTEQVANTFPLTGLSRLSAFVNSDVKHRTRQAAVPLSRTSVCVCVCNLNLLQKYFLSDSNKDQVRLLCVSFCATEWNN